MVYSTPPSPFTNSPTVSLTVSLVVELVVASKLPKLVEWVKVGLMLWPSKSFCAPTLNVILIHSMVIRWANLKSATVPNYLLAEYVYGTGGIRTYPYSTSHSVNPLMYSTIQKLNEVHGMSFCPNFLDVIVS